MFQYLVTYTDKSLSQAVDLLNSFASKKYPKVITITYLNAKENTSDKENLKRLVCVDTGCLGIIAIAFNDELKVDPVEFIDSVFRDADLKNHNT